MFFKTPNYFIVKVSRLRRGGNPESLAKRQINFSGTGRRGLAASSREAGTGGESVRLFPGVLGSRERCLSPGSNAACHCTGTLEKETGDLHDKFPPRTQAKQETSPLDGGSSAARCWPYPRGTWSPPEDPSAVHLPRREGPRPTEGGKGRPS